MRVCGGTPARQPYAHMRMIRRMVFTVGVMGASGYSGGELLRLIDAHPALTLVAAGAREQAGAPIVGVHPQLDCDPGECFVSNDSAAMAAADIVFMALPAGKSGELGQVVESARLVIDLGADHRLRDLSDWEEYYPGARSSEPWVYGLPELPGQRPAISAASRIANPGCYATVVQLALAPLLAAGCLTDDVIAVSAASGTSGAGRAAADGLMASNVLGSMSAYKVGGVHQHTPEIEQGLADASGRPVRVSFTPLLAPMPRGIIATCFGRRSERIGADEVRRVLAGAYDAEPFVTLLPEGSWPATSAVSGTNRVLLNATVDERTEMVTVVGALDNLGKGAAGQAIQNLNIALSLPETTGLTGNGVRP